MKVIQAKRSCSGTYRRNKEQARSILSHLCCPFLGLETRCKDKSLIGCSIVAGFLEKISAFTLKELNKFAQLKTCENLSGVHAISKKESKVTLATPHT
jgi:hypothetical protein